MFRLSHFLLARGAGYVKSSSVSDPLWMRYFTAPASIATTTQNLMTGGDYGRRPLVDYPIFKGKAALAMKPVPPKFTKLDSGSMKLGRMGVIMLTFWPAIGQRKYDWQKRQVFALSPVELGSLISLGPTESCEFFHDPSMKTSLAGQVRKTLSVNPMSDAGGYIFHLTVVDSKQRINERLSVPVSKAEFAVIRTSFNYILPHIMGWDCLIGPVPHPENTLKAIPRKQLDMELPSDLEWSR